VQDFQRLETVFPRHPDIPAKDAVLFDISG